MIKWRCRCQYCRRLGRRREKVRTKILIRKHTHKIGLLCLLAMLSLAVSGCYQKGENGAEMEVQTQSQAQSQPQLDITDEPTEPSAEETTYTSPPAAPTVSEVDWSEYFEGLNGAAVVFDPAAGEYAVYNRELADTRRSPCSTFKIVSSLVGLESGVIPAGDSVRTWSGEHFWNEDWNRNIGFEDAFRTSCIWYFRDVIDELGPETVQKELDRLEYGNCDISDWEGLINTNNGKMALRGFWVESSLKISAMEQVNVMDRIFGESSRYQAQTLEQLKAVMKLTGWEELPFTIYGKTGMGKTDGITVDSWYTGFAEAQGRVMYFCVYLGRTDGMEVSSDRAREIAVRVLSDYYEAGEE